WKTVADPQRATEVFRKNLLGQREEMAPLRLSIDIREDVNKQEMAIISFYKSRQTKWSRPLRWTLEGDVATGDGVTRHLFSLIMKNLQHGFHLNFGRADVVPMMFPRLSATACSAKTVLDHIEWPLELSSDDEGEYSMTVKSQVAEYLRQFIENASPTQLRQLVTFWVGWDIPMKGMQVHVVKGDFPR
ncbi:hypothetical protein KUCAC02_003637, partial [Chaenocephalus aceratus]